MFIYSYITCTKRDKVKTNKLGQQNHYHRATLHIIPKFELPGCKLTLFGSSKIILVKFTS